ncbi:tetratricopeptide repeat protein [Chlorobium sp. N1]|uniref:tetratricopeptide repeat protein n=1 Tax=Chlorobium sp. N1 TaxID=2491138 RepID=UPI00103D78F0|nr:tetratricopeptide repeat protein [Chlorobium sp. N1]TCD47650.1 tetratricopeptide repeat protein [Chlorobium sp. N1]
MNDIDTQSARPETNPSVAENLLYLLLRHKNIIAGALVFVLATGAAAFFWIQRQAALEKEAAPLLSAAAAAYDRGDYQTALDGTKESVGLKTISERYDGTPSGEMAELLLANAYHATGMNEEALRAFSDVSLKSPDLQAAALAGRASAESDLKKYRQAAASFEAAAAKAGNTALKSQYLTAAAGNMLEAGETEKAQKLFREVVDRYPGSTGSGIAQRALWKISGTLEAKEN